MISLIICSREGYISDTLMRNINDTVKLPYELVVIDNSKNEYSIFDAYNTGAERSKSDILCFMHEDILFKTYGWGLIVKEALMNPQVGVIGVAGSKVKTKTISPWWIADNYQSNDIFFNNVIHTEDELVKLQSLNVKGDNLIEVAVIDGVWMCCKKHIWENAKFDSVTYNNFHFYDLDLCMQVYMQGFRNYVFTNIFIEHNSTGNINYEWINAAQAFHKKWQNNLPIVVNTFTNAIVKKLEHSALSNYLWILIKCHHGSLYSKVLIWGKLLVIGYPISSLSLQFYSIIKSFMKKY